MKHRLDSRADDSVIDMPANNEDLKCRKGRAKLHRVTPPSNLGDGKKDKPKRKQSYNPLSLISGLIGAFCTPRYLHQYMPYIFFIEVALVVPFGVLVAIPFFHRDEKDGNSCLIQQVIGSVICLQMIVNWFLIRYTNPSFMSSSFPVQSAKLRENPLEFPDFLFNPERPRATKQQQANGLYPYWTWSPCFICKIWRPPRCHHCVLCNKCILKRDHHCFFARVCVGYKNQRHFSVFVLWAFSAAVFSSYHGFRYFYITIWPHITILDIIPGFSFLRYLFGFEHGSAGVLVLMAWILIMMDFVSCMQMFGLFSSIFSGRTSFERDNDIDVNDNRTFLQKMRSIFGKWFILSFMLPIPFPVLPSEEDPFHWTTVIAPRRNPLIKILDPSVQENWEKCEE